LLEAAVFDPIQVRIHAKKTNLRTDSAQRFEKGIDASATALALDAACQLIAELTGGKISAHGVDIAARDLHPKKIACRISRANQILGTHLSLNEVKTIFQRLHFPVHAAEKETLLVEVPLYRNDISEEIDLIEEIARIYGYNNIEKRAPLCRTSALKPDPLYVFEREVKERLVSLGLQEFLTCDLISPALGAIAREMSASHMKFLHMLHSKSEEYSVLRPSLLPGLLQTVKNNLAHKNLSLHAFETGRIHFSEHGHIAEIPMAAILLTGKALSPHWSHKDREVDFFDLKGLLEAFCEAIAAPTPQFIHSQHMSFHPGRQASLEIGGLIIGSLGEIHPNFLDPFGIKQRVFFAELQLPALLDRRKTHLRMTPLSTFPSSERDWTLSLPLQMQIGTVLEKIEKERSPLLEKIELIDLYQPEDASQKNATLRFTYRGKEKTASFEEVEAAHTKLVQSVEGSLL
jgi:phenylalanyl-tRNA synthetase beta chain